MEITIDTSVWIDLIKKTANFDQIDKLLKLCNEKFIQIYISSRVINYDIVEMPDDQKEEFEKIITNYNILIDPAPFRLSSEKSKRGSRFGDKDFFISLATSEEEKKFIKVFGNDPIRFPEKEVGNRLSNWIGDYDSLKQHFLNKRTIYVTFDTKLYFSIQKRNEAKKELNIIITDPENAIKILKSML